MPGEVNCIFTKVLIPFVEKEVGPEGAATILRTAGRPREYLIADHNWLPLALADRLVHLAMELTGEPDEDRWARRFTEYTMDWKPSREQRAYIGTYTMALGSPRAIFGKLPQIYHMTFRVCDSELIDFRRRQATVRVTPRPGYALPRWACTWMRICAERFPMNWGLPRARIIESACAARGDTACVWELHWRNPSLGTAFWTSTAAGAAVAATLPAAAGRGIAGWSDDVLFTVLPLGLGVTLGYALRERHRRRETQRLLELQGEEVVYSNDQLEKKFRDLEDKIEQLSLLIELSAAVNATLDPEKIYEQALDRLVHRMGYQGAYLYLVDAERRLVRQHKTIGGGEWFEGVDFPVDAPDRAAAKVIRTGLPLLVNDTETTTEPVHRPTARSLGVRSLIMVPLRVKERVFGVLTVVASDKDRFTDADVDVISAVANHVSLAVDRAESFQTIEELTRGLEDKVRVRTEQLRSANEELEAAYRDLQATQMQLIQREKMASVGQLVAGVAHELNNPIGFVSSNVTTLEEFVKRLRSMLEVYRAVPLPDAERERVEGQWAALKVDYALKYLDSMILGIREGAERTRKIVRDLRVFARSDDDVWQPVDLHEEIESSLTLLNHLLKDRVTVHRKFGDLPSVECVRSQIDQVFLNLLANAAQAITGEGAITIETRREDGGAVVTISDTGPGIAQDVIGRIFDPFFTTKPVGEGTGLGLSISYEILKKHRGEITAASPPGSGATFTVRLPMTRTA
jgi:signal transduction histidine kinase